MNFSCEKDFSNLIQAINSKGLNYIWQRNSLNVT